MFGRGQLYLSIVELSVLLLSLVLSVLQACLSALSLPLLGSQLRSELLVLLLSCTQGLAGLGAKVAFKPSLILGVLHPLLGYKDLLDGLH